MEAPIVMFLFPTVQALPTSSQVLNPFRYWNLCPLQLKPFICSGDKSPGEPQVLTPLLQPDWGAACLSSSGHSTVAAYGGLRRACSISSEWKHPQEVRKIDLCFGLTSVPAVILVRNCQVLADWEDRTGKERKEAGTCLLWFSLCLDGDKVEERKQ